MRGRFIREARPPRLSGSVGRTREMGVLITIVGLWLALATGAKSVSAPRFEDFPSEVADKPASAQIRGPDLDSHPLAKRYRTILRRGAAGEANFAGHFNAIRIGCGSSCAFLAIVNRSTGRVYFPAELGVLSWAEWPADTYGYTFRADSRMIRACGDPKESGHPG